MGLLKPFPQAEDALPPPSVHELQALYGCAVGMRARGVSIYGEKDANLEDMDLLIVGLGIAIQHGHKDQHDSGVCTNDCTNTSIIGSSPLQHRCLSVNTWEVSCCWQARHASSTVRARQWTMIV